MLIKDFFANREIFITGATGFLGKSMIEKLLRDIPKIKVLYILMRDKKSISANERLEQLKKDKVFDRIHKECPEVLNKLHGIQGDCQELGLGIKPNDLELLKNVSIIFHMAANVKFDDSLRSSILLNSRGTYELLKIAEGLKNLVVFMHCSTAYCNPFNNVVEEKVYKMSVDWRKTIKIAETYDEYTINVLCQKYSGYYPNTYTFTKNLSEQIIQDYSAKLPVVIFRPTIVSSAYTEPVPGWIENLNGPMAIIIGIGVGVLPVINSCGSLTLDYVPVDMVTKLTIVAAYKRGLQFLRKENISNDPDVINCATNNHFNVNSKCAVELFVNVTQQNPMENCIWRYDSVMITSCYYNFLFNILLTNLPLTLIIDNLLRLFGRKTLMMKILRRIIYTSKTISFFTLKEYKMINENMFDLENWIPESEKEEYLTLVHVKDPDIIEYFENLLCGIKYNLFNDPPKATETARKRYKILYFINQIMKIILFSIVVYYLWLVIVN